MNVCSHTLLVLFAYIVTIVNGNFIYQKGECPEGKEPGDEWINDDCKSCVCEEGSYYCYVCPSETISEQLGCYIEKREIEGTIYPVCCYPFVHVCPKDDNFSEKKYEEYISKSDHSFTLFPLKIIAELREKLKQIHE